MQRGGTTVSVTLPLEQVPQSPEKALLGPHDDQVFEDQLRDLEGLRVGMSLSYYGDDDRMSDWQNCVPEIRHDALPCVSEDIQALANSPNVLSCPNAPLGYRQSKPFELAGCAAVFEFIDQPIGPRKLARALLLAYTRWMSVSESPTELVHHDEHL